MYKYTLLLLNAILLLIIIIKCYINQSKLFILFQLLGIFAGIKVICILVLGIHYDTLQWLLYGCRAVIVDF